MSRKHKPEQVLGPVQEGIVMPPVVQEIRPIIVTKDDIMQKLSTRINGLTKDIDDFVKERERVGGYDVNATVILEMAQGLLALSKAIGELIQTLRLPDDYMESADGEQI